MIPRINTTILILCLILVLGFGLRVYKLADIPSGFFSDDAAIGFNAYKLLTSGKDEYGKNFPFYFQSFGDYRPPVTIYSMIPSIAVFGLNEFSVRLTSALYGTVNIILIFFLVQLLPLKLSKEQRNIAAIFSSLFLAISPWHIHFSRIGWEVILIPFFVTLSLLLLFLAMREMKHDEKEKLTKKAYALFFISMISFVVTFYTYYHIQIVLATFLFGLIIIYRRVFFAKKIRSVTILGLTIFILGLMPFLLGILSGTALTRFNSTSPLARIKSVADFEILAPRMISTYVNNFSPDFLFAKGDIGMPGHFITRHSVKGMGELYLFQAPLLLIGFFFLFRREKQAFLFFLLWLILYPLGSMIVGEGPFAHRSIFGVIAFQIISGYGLAILAMYVAKSQTKKIFFWTLIISLIVVSTLSYKEKYFKEYPLYSSDFWGWQYGPRETMAYFLSNKDRYDDLYMSGEFNGGEIFIKFYDPQNRCEGKCKLGDFFRQPEIYNPSHRQLFSISPHYLQNSSFKDRFSVQHTVYYPNGDIAFLLGEVVE